MAIKEKETVGKILYNIQRFLFGEVFWIVPLIISVYMLYAMSRKNKNG